MIHSTACNLQPWCFGIFLQLLSTVVYFTTSVFLNIVDMGSAESQFDDGVLPGDSQRDERAPQFLTPDMLERTWLDLAPSPDLELPGKRAFGEASFATNRFASALNGNGSVWLAQQTHSGSNWRSLQRCPGEFWWLTTGGKSLPIQMQFLGKKTKRPRWMLL